MTAPLPPKPWRVEMLGLGEQVTFSHPDGLKLMWGDGVWYVGKGSVMRSVAGIPPAVSMAEAGTVGSEWLGQHFGGAA